MALLDSLARITQVLSRLAVWIAAAGLVAMTVIIGWQIFARYILNDTPHWSEVSSVYLMLYYILLAAAVGVREQTHLGIVFIRDALPTPVRSTVVVLTNVLIAGFGVFMIVYGGEIAARTWNQTIPTLGLPTGSRYLAFPISGGLVILFALEHILNALAPARRSIP